MTKLTFLKLNFEKNYEKFDKDKNLNLGPLGCKYLADSIRELPNLRYLYL